MPFIYSKAILKALKLVSFNNRERGNKLVNIELKLDLNNREFMFERIDKPNYNHYRKWNALTKKILNISGL